MKKIVRMFRHAAAISPESATDLSGNSITRSMVFRKMMRQGIIVRTTEHHYYLDEEREAYCRERRRKIVFVALVVVVIGIVVSLMLNAS